MATLHRKTLRHPAYAGYKSYATYREFAEASLAFLREKTRKTDHSSAIWSPTISASSTRSIFGFWRQQGIIREGTFSKEQR